MKFFGIDIQLFKKQQNDEPCFTRGKKMPRMRHKKKYAPSVIHPDSNDYIDSELSSNLECNGFSRGSSSTSSDGRAVHKSVRSIGLSPTNSIITHNKTNNIYEFTMPPTTSRRVSRQGAGFVGKNKGKETLDKTKLPTITVTPIHIAVNLTKKPRDPLLAVNSKWQRMMNTIPEEKKNKRHISFNETVICHPIPRIIDILEMYDAEEAKSRGGIKCIQKTIFQYDGEPRDDKISTNDDLSDVASKIIDGNPIFDCESEIDDDFDDMDIMDMVIKDLDSDLKEMKGIESKGCILLDDNSNDSESVTSVTSMGPGCPTPDRILTPLMHFEDVSTSESSNAGEFDTEDSIVQLELLLNHARYERTNLYTKYEQNQIKENQETTVTNKTKKSVQFEQRTSNLQKCFINSTVDGFPANILESSRVSDHTLTDCIPEEKTQKFNLKDKFVNFKNYIGGKLFRNKSKVSPEPVIVCQALSVRITPE